MRKIFFTFCAAALCGTTGIAQTTVLRDPSIEKMVKEVSADSLQSYIKALVATGTRNTLSTQADPKKGIGAARNWVLAKFNEFAKQSGGRLTAMIDTTTLAADGKRVDAPLLLGNVVATLQGTDPNDHRLFLISGHLDSRRSDVMDRTGDAPGANDDGSGTATVIECARIMSRYPFSATVIFVAVSGEEQG
ncbi:MAG TPA: M28 family peptidase, partial [Chitinophagaceae bacterium]|nr:M28 family peptidase [Chitinophagaceae bacterium]